MVCILFCNFKTNVVCLLCPTLACSAPACTESHAERDQLDADGLPRLAGLSSPRDGSSAPQATQQWSVWAPAHGSVQPPAQPTSQPTPWSCTGNNAPPQAAEWAGTGSTPPQPAAWPDAGSSERAAGRTGSHATGRFVNLSLRDVCDLLGATSTITEPEKVWY